MNRRKFLKTVGIASGTTLLSSKLSAEEIDTGKEFNAVLVDTTLCVGCRTCEESCAEAHGNPDPNIDDETVFENERTTSTEQWTVVNRYESEDYEIFRKDQCMHCAQPACAAACLTKAMLKTEEGPVIWRADKCMGCRYCMVSCPFDVPKFEFDKTFPTIQKCNLCYDRFTEGEIPACVENCPAEALSFGSRREMIREARRRIVENPDEYHDHIYGEHEAGGTSYLYVGAEPMESIGMKAGLGTVAFPNYSKGFLYSVPFILLLWPAFLYGLSKTSNQKDDETTEE